MPGYLAELCKLACLCIFCRLIAWVLSIFGFPVLHRRLYPTLKAGRWFEFDHHIQSFHSAAYLHCIQYSQRNRLFKTAVEDLVKTLRPFSLRLLRCPNAAFPRQLGKIPASARIKWA